MMVCCVSRLVWLRPAVAPARSRPPCPWVWVWDWALPPWSARHGHHLIRGCRQMNRLPANLWTSWSATYPCSATASARCVPPAQPWLQAAQRESQPHPQPSAVRPEAFRQVPVSGGSAAKGASHAGPAGEVARRSKSKDRAKTEGTKRRPRPSLSGFWSSDDGLEDEAPAQPAAGPLAVAYRNPLSMMSLAGPCRTVRRLPDRIRRATTPSRRIHSNPPRAAETSSPPPACRSPRARRGKTRWSRGARGPRWPSLRPDRCCRRDPPPSTAPCSSPSPATARRWPATSYSTNTLTWKKESQCRSERGSEEMSSDRDKHYTDKSYRIL